MRKCTLAHAISASGPFRSSAVTLLHFDVNETLAALRTSQNIIASVASLVDGDASSLRASVFCIRVQGPLG